MNGRKNVTNTKNLPPTIGKKALQRQIKIPRYSKFAPFGEVSHSLEAEFPNFWYFMMPY